MTHADNLSVVHRQDLEDRRSNLVRRIAELEEQNKILLRASIAKLQAEMEEAKKLRLLAEIDRIQKVIDSKNRARCVQKSLNSRTDKLEHDIKAEFDRINFLSDSNVTMETERTPVEDPEVPDTLWIKFSRGDVAGSIRIPLPIVTEHGYELIHNKDVTRVLCDYWLETTQERLNYHDIMSVLFCEDVQKVMPMVTSVVPMISKIVKSFNKDQALYMISNMQKLVSEVVNRFPLHETDLSSWAMSHRVVVIDPEFESITNPNRRLEYQVSKNKKYYYMYGWTALGLSDGVLADKNYLLTTDLRALTPYGHHHNPQRNLYSTLKMEGDELPRVRSKSTQELIKRGISRYGWNMVTAILDTPLNFEDQILVDKRHLGLSHSVDRRFIVYGKKLQVKKGDSIKTGDVIGYCDDGQAVPMNLRCDEAKVSSIRPDSVELSGHRVPVLVVKVTGKRFLRDGTKFSNAHGNKGVVRFLDLGYAVDPRTGKHVPIDVLISGTSINKRKNFGQLLEMITNNIVPGDQPIVVADDLTVDKIKIGNALERAGFPKDGTWMISTYCGEFESVVGKMFWGVTKDPEDQLWDDDRTDLTNNRELRTSGLKFSHVELKALTTHFGPGNPVVKEILSHAQGVEILQDEIRILRSAAGDLDAYYPVIDAVDVNYVNLSTGVFHELSEIKGTIVDDEFMPEGFILRLPSYFQVVVNKRDPEEFVWGIPQKLSEEERAELNVYEYNTIFVPNALLRRCWRHKSGKWGLNTLGAHLNHIVECCHKYLAREDIAGTMDIARAVCRYFAGVSKSMGTKSGELSTYGMAIRYPFSSRATAALSDNLPKDTIEIHEDMAKILKVKTGDVVIAERFPCLGFVSIRPQYVRVTKDPQCKFVIRVSGNSLVSMNLDFDGDTLFLASFHTPQAIEALRNEMKSPNKACRDAIEKINAKKVPQTLEMSLDTFNICSFPKPDVEEHADIVRKATGVKSHTGPVIALAYNLMRIVEANIPYTHIEEHVHLELLLDFLGNTVFKQKHGIKSLQEEATDAICMGNVNEMVRLGFDSRPSQLLCDLIRKEAKSIGVHDLVDYHNKAKIRGWSKIINLIVRNKHRIYFASRSMLGPFALLECLNGKPRDLPSLLFKQLIRNDREVIEEKIDRLKASRMKIKNILATKQMKEVFDILAAYIDDMTTKKVPASIAVN